MATATVRLTDRDEKKRDTESCECESDRDIMRASDEIVDRRGGREGWVKNKRGT